MIFLQGGPKFEVSPLTASSSVGHKWLNWLAENPRLVYKSLRLISYTS